MTLSALELMSLDVERTVRENQAIHDKLMKLQEDFLRRISERLQGSERVLQRKMARIGATMAEVRMTA